MIRLRLFGAIELHGSQGAEHSAILAQPKRLSLLAYLAAATPRGFQRRDSLLGLFWPELDDAHARKALNQAIGFLRHQLQTDGEVIVNRGLESVSVDARECWCDAVAFDEAIAAGRFEEALNLYTGDFLDGWFVEQAAGFEEWAERQRSRLRGLAAQAARAVSEAEHRDGNDSKALWAARRSVDLSGPGEPAVRYLLELLDATGDRAGALHAYNEFARRVAEEFGVEPSAETRALVERIRSRNSPNAAATGESRQLEPSAGSYAVRSLEESTPRAGTDLDIVRPQRSRWRAARAGMIALSVLVVLAIVWRGTHPISNGPASAQPRQSGVAIVRPSSAPVVGPTAPASLPDRPLATTPSSGTLGRTSNVGNDQLDQDLVMVLPFRVATPDSSFGYLREGMIDLLAAKFTGSLQVADPYAVVAGVRRAGVGDIDTDVAAALGRRLGAALILRGAITSASELLVFSATVTDIRSGVRNSVTTEGPRDSLAALVDRLAGKLLALRANEDVRSLASLQDTPFATLREYLTGQSLSRRGRFEDAIPHYRAAIAADSEFALANIGLALAIVSTSGVNAEVRGAWNLATRARNRLSSRDRAVLDGMIGQTFPVVSSVAELQALAEQAVRVAPDHIAAWSNLANLLHEHGAIQDIPDWPKRAIAAFDRAIALDSTSFTILQPMPGLYLRIGDSVRARRAMEYTLRLDSTSIVGSYQMWSAGNAFGNADRRARGLEALLRSGSVSTSGNVKHWALLTGRGFEDEEWLMERLHKNAVTDEIRISTAAHLLNLRMLRGQPKRAALVLDSVPALRTRPGTLNALLLGAMFGSADSAVAAVMRSRVTTSVERDSTLGGCFASVMQAAYDLEVQGDATNAELVIRALDARLTPSLNRAIHRRCLAGNRILGVLLATKRADPTLRAQTELLDSLLRTGPSVGDLVLVTGNLIIARAWEKLNEPRRALAAVRRRVLMWDPINGYDTMIHEEARLAAITGDRKGAIHAYRTFVALHRDAEPALQPQLAHAVAELARLDRQR